MGALDQPTFERVVSAGCPACAGATLEIRSFIERSLVLMLADPNDAGRWVHDGEKFVDGAYCITCVSCSHTVWARDVCPRCNQAGGLSRALEGTSQLGVPKRCPTCNELELLAVALVPAAARYGTGDPPI